MDPIQLILMIVIAAVAAALAVGLMGSEKTNWGVNALIAFVGAYLGHWIQYRMAFPAILPVTINNAQYEFLWSLMGAFLFIFILRFAHGSDL